MWNVDRLPGGAVAMFAGIVLMGAWVTVAWGGAVTETQATSAPAEYPTSISNREAWAPYLAAAAELNKGQSRERMAKVFAGIADPYAQEIGKLLGQMAEEDSKFVEPADAGKLDEKERLAWLVYKLREVAETDMFVPGKVEVVRYPSDAKSAAVQVRRMGKAAVPTLMGLLEDRRPTRSVGASLNGGRVLRYCDVALEILEAISCETFDGRTVRGSYLSTANAAEREKIVGRVRAWWKDNREGTEPQWIRRSFEKQGVGDATGERLIALEGRGAVETFRKYVAADPGQANVVRLLWMAGGGEVLADLRAAAKSPQVGVRSTAYHALIQEGQVEYIATAAADLAEAVAHPERKYDGGYGDMDYQALMGGLAYSGNGAAVAVVAKYIGDGNREVAEEAHRAVFNAQDWWEREKPGVACEMLPQGMLVVNDEKESLEHRFGAAMWVIRSGKILVEEPEHPTAEQRAKTVAQLQAWWKEHGEAHMEMMRKQATPAPATQEGRERDGG